MSKANMSDIQFTPWAVAQPPQEERAYLWRVPSTGVAGVAVEFVAWMRERGAGYERVISPAFDYWDGYRVHVPAGIEWAPTNVECKDHEYKAVRVDGIDPLPCPYCATAPRLDGAQYLSMGGLHHGAAPYHWNCWWFVCCNWMKGLTGPNYSDPRDLNRVRNEKLLTFARSVTDKS